MRRGFFSRIWRRVGLWVSTGVESRIARWPRARLRLAVVVLGILAAAWCGWMLGSALYAIFNHH
jgi:hypothetical protein